MLARYASGALLIGALLFAQNPQIPERVGRLEQRAETNSKRLDDMSASKLAERMAAAEESEGNNAETLSRIERWLLVAIGLIGGKIALDQRALARLAKDTEALRERVDAVEFDTQRLRQHFHALNGWVMQVNYQFEQKTGHPLPEYKLPPLSHQDPRYHPIPEDEQENG